MNYADIAILAILVISVLLGFIKGFWKTFSKVVVVALSIVVAFMLAGKLAGVMFNDSALESINMLVSKAVLKTPLTEASVITQGSDIFVVTTEGNITMDEALKLMLIPTFLHAPIIASASGLTAPITLGALVGSAYTHLVSMFIAGAVVFIVVRIVLGVISSLLYKAIAYKQFHRVIDRILGALFRILTGGMFIAIVFNIIGVLSGFEFMAPVIEQVETGKISSFVYEADFLGKIFYGEGMTKVLDIFKNVIGTVVPPEGATAMGIVSALLV